MASESRKLDYTRLERDEFRLVEVLPDPEPSKPVRCLLATFKRNTETPFDALSYTWGSPHHLSSIFVDGRPFLVRDNLVSALRRLRQADVPVRLWVDALCINQQDAEEKSWAVANMHEHYRRARRTLAWLGEAANDSDLAMDVIAMAKSRVKKEGMGAHAVFQCGFLRYRMDQFSELAVLDPALLYDMLADGAKSESVARRTQALDHLFRRPWWRRLWIIPEVFHAHQCMVYCGSKGVSWPALVCAHKTLSLARADAASFYWYTDPKLPSTVAVLWGHDSAMHLGELLRALNGYQTADPRDQIFICRLFVYRETALDLEVDYEQSIEQVYTNATRVMALEDQDLNFLAQMDRTEHKCVHVQGQPKGSLRLPSWVPDWSRRVTFSAFPYDLYKSCGLGVCASHVENTLIGDSRDALYHGWLYSERLRVYGFVIGTIVRIAYSEYDPSNLLQQVLNGSKEALRQFDSFVDTGSLHINKATSDISFNEQLEEALVRGLPPAEPSGPEVSKEGDAWVLFVANNGVRGVASGRAQWGDIVGIINGCDVPVVLRGEAGATDAREDWHDDIVNGYKLPGVPDTKFYQWLLGDWQQVIGGAYVYGFMNGEAVPGGWNGRFSEQLEFNLR